MLYLYFVFSLCLAQHIGQYAYFPLVDCDFLFLGISTPNECSLFQLFYELGSVRAVFIIQYGKQDFNLMLRWGGGNYFDGVAPNEHQPAKTIAEQHFNVIRKSSGVKSSRDLRLSMDLKLTPRECSKPIANEEHDCV